MSRDIGIVHIEETRRRRITENTKIVRYMKLETLLLMPADGGFLSRALRLWEDPTAWRRASFLVLPIGAGSGKAGQKKSGHAWMLF